MRSAARIVLGTLITVASYTAIDIPFDKFSSNLHAVVSQQDTTKELSLEEIMKDLEENPSIVNNWIRIFETPEKVRLIVDKKTLDIIDTIPNSKNAIRQYFKNHPKSKDLTSIRGMKRFMEEGLENYVASEEILTQPFEKEDIPNDLSYLSVVETGVKNMKSKAGAVGKWQILPSRKGFLTVNKKNDERNSTTKSTKRAAEILKSLYTIFPSYSLAATGYILGPYGTAKGLEKVLELNCPSSMFKSYSNMVYFHQDNDLMVYDPSKFAKAFKKFNGQMWNNTISKFKKEKNPEMMATLELYTQYWRNVRSDPIPEFAFTKKGLTFVDPTKKHYIKSFTEYHGITEDLRKAYWRLHTYLQGTKNNFDSPQYVPRLLATISWMNQKRNTIAQ
jgi:hypothetical protein